MSEWKMPSLKDELDKGRAAQQKALGSELAQAVVAAAPENPPAECPICGRTTSANALLDVRGITAANRARLRLREGAEYVCDACRERWIAEKRVTRPELLTMLGAPTAVRNAAEDREARRVKSMSKPATVVESRPER